jgi:VWFA-related protein
VAIAAAGIAAFAQTPPKPGEQDPQRPTFRTEANFVRVDVYPTSSGKPLADLRREDFEVLEDGRPQAIETFEFVRVGGPRVDGAITDPNTVEAMRQAAANPRSRVFVVFLDAQFVTREGAKYVSEALIRFVNRVLGPDDLIGFMTSGMAASDVTFARRTEVIERALRNAPWGERFAGSEDDREALYKQCYRVLQQELEQGKSVSDLARALTVRRREVLTLEALRELVVYLRGIREERKAILVVTEGWALYRPDARITRLREECTCPLGRRVDLQDCTGCKPYPPFAPWKEPVPGNDPIEVRRGRLTVGGIETLDGVMTNDCKGDRNRLASIDNERFLRDLADDANRANASFYTIDPRGLAAFDTPIHRDMNEVGLPLTAAEDAQHLSRRLGALKDLAVATDGIALTSSNDLDAGLRRVSDDLASYYLLGYYSTNAKLDGRFRAITVRVKRPGVEVRARRGYRSPTEAEVAAARASTQAAVAAAPPTAFATALAALVPARAGARFRVHAIPVRMTRGGQVSAIWIAGELPATLSGWAQGGRISLDVSGAGFSHTAEVTLGPGERGFVTAVPIDRALAAVDVRARATHPDPAVTPFTERVRVDLGPAAPPGALLFRRGPATGNRFQPAADFQFARSERVRVDAPLPPDAKAGAGRVLDRAAQELKVPVDVSERTDKDGGQRWLSADIALAALGAGEYVIELTASTAGGEQKILTAIRVTR